MRDKRSPYFGCIYHLKDNSTMNKTEAQLVISH